VTGVLFTAVTINYYTEFLAATPYVSYVSTNILGLTRHALERFVYCLLVAYAGWFLGIRAGIVLLGAVLVTMFPRAIFISAAPRDAIFETVLAGVVSGLLLALIYALKRLYQSRNDLMNAMTRLADSERQYRELFEDASDAIWVHGLDGKITRANRATEILNGYTMNEMLGKNVRDFLSEDGYHIARKVKEKLLVSKDVPTRYEQHLFRKDGSEAIVELTTRVITENGRPSAFQNIARDVTEERRLQANLHFYLQKILEAQERERKRIARDLHDDTAQSLLYIVHQLDAVLSNNAAGLGSESAGKLAKLHSVAVATHDALRRYTKQLRPAILDDLGLGPALEWLADNLTAETDSDVTIQISPLPRNLPHEVQLTLFRIAQEALANIKRHAEATQAGIRLACSGDYIRMTISDNGKGFEVPGLLSDFSSLGKLGLAGMQERIQLLGGSLYVQSTPGKGTTVVIEVPAYPVGTVKAGQS
jgi:PAS domain S-box-containing protein